MFVTADKEHTMASTPGQTWCAGLVSDSIKKFKLLSRCKQAHAIKKQCRELTKCETASLDQQFHDSADFADLSDASLDSTEVLRPTRPKICHLRDILPSQSLGLVLKT